MKRAHLLSLLATVLICSFTLSITSSCNRDKCKKVVCPPGKDCLDGECVCPTGYEGKNCDTVSREKLIGNYYVNQNCPGSGSTAYYSSITEGSDIQKIEINNIVDSGLYCYADVTENTVIIPSQNIGSITIEGQGNYTVALHQLTLYLDYTQSGVQEQCTLTMNKQ